MLELAIAGVLAVSLALYMIFAGADFGAGILTLLSFNKSEAQAEKEQKLIYKAMGPVWEANHIWLILAVVILFVGFPKYFHMICVYLHWPLTMILIGIVLRGCAFTFMHYDPIKDHWQLIYRRLFAWSSLWTSIWLGLAVASLSTGLIGQTGLSYAAIYIEPWLSLYGLSLGCFLACLFAFLASVFLSGETVEQKEMLFLKKRAKTCLLATVGFGGVVFLAGETSGFGLISRFYSNNYSLGFMLLATLTLGLTLKFFTTKKRWLLRFLAGFIAVQIFAGWVAFQYPEFVLTPAGGVSLFAGMAPERTLWQLFYALLVGLLLITPALIYLFATFSAQKSKVSS